MSENKNVRTRFAPSPTGYLHIGGLRTALYAYLFAKKNGGDYILRIEDTDRNRLVEGATEKLIEILKWAGIEHDEGPDIGGQYGPYVQSERNDIYREYVNQLIDDGYAYHCFCTKERLDELRTWQQENKQPPKYDGKCRDLSKEEVEKRIAAGESYVIRMRVPLNEVIEFNDAVRGKISVNTKEIDDQVLMKADGYPTYHLANVVDDHEMKITHVIRGEEWISSTPKHVLLYRYFGWDMPTFAHLPLLLNKDRSKLSKRQNDVAVEDYKQAGYLKDALNNFVALLGWNPGDDKEIMTMDDLVSLFSLEKVHKAGAVFDREKLDWMNGMYIRNLSIDEFYTFAKPYLAQFEHEDEDYVKSVIALEQTRVKKLTELAESITLFFEKELEYEKELLKWKKADLDEAKVRLLQVKEFLASYEKQWSIENLENDIKAFIKENDLGVGNTLWPLRIALSGKQNSPSPFELLSVLGKDRANSRIEKAVSLL